MPSDLLCANFFQKLHAPGPNWKSDCDIPNSRLHSRKKKVRAQRPLPTRITDLLVMDNPVLPKECPELYSTRHSHYSWTRITVREDLICSEIEFLAGGFPGPE
ncbi:hypothetical protein NXS19_005592 [Fusarium pseudograminearum]|uniref:Uncharacterized protein n=1 Tax=Fusarium pseudograminearum (strain CS3096) TaxID=1028729 RepID=K3V454_FUSPC|nr:hypothetical protein FPSE_11960 [Fusarium pseudograminearum CS3096]EKJ67812.1 hypothetical protein FPSE_11960 [Fusarium pseudograminearum CS3096]KAF0636916.1 hypothetical protein FPSE5266_11960 [Fusarium pseudograminearum]UZP37776.1 hypothetical protein NXS19_005592 [Fusarium pseudograminearum]